MTPESEPDANVSIRTAAAGILVRWQHTGTFPDRLLPNSPTDRALLMELVYGTIRRHRALAWMVNAGGLQRPPDPLTMSYLLIGAYQIFYMDHIPPHAIVSETVKAAREKLDQRRAGFINAILRNLLRQRDSVAEQLLAQPLAVRESHPDGMIQRWSRNFGAEEAEALARWNNTQPGVILRVNTLRTTDEAFRKQLEDGAVSILPTPDAWPDHYLALSHGIRVSDIPGYREGCFYVQDPAAESAVRLLDAQPGDAVLDTCAAPGGKTLGIAAAMRNQGRITALEPLAERLTQLKDNLARARVTCATVIQGAADDASRLPAELEPGSYDRILLDVPCSNTGVLRRRPDARWRFSEGELRKVCALQYRILTATAGLLKPGGRLVYSTCSLEPEENDEQITRFLRDHADFALTQRAFLLPPQGATDGAFACALDKTGAA